MKRRNIFWLIIVLIGFPLLFWAIGDFPRRTVLKEVLSVLTLTAFSMIIGQFYFSRIFRESLNLPSMAKLTKYHKVFGYIFVGILLVHPFFIVIPRFFEAGVEPVEAFITLITTYDSTGVVLGIIAWFLMLIIGLTSFFRKKTFIKLHKLAFTAWNTFNCIHHNSILACHRPWQAYRFANKYIHNIIGWSWCATPVKYIFAKTKE